MGRSGELIKKFRDYADCADASYAMLHYVYDNDIFFDDDWKEADNITRYAKIQSDIKSEEGDILHKAGDNTAYARAIEARFCQDKVIGKEGDYCLPFTKACLSSKDKTLANDPKNVSPTDTLSLRTQN
ncbi:hypothetical protein CQA53_11535, partial [Helicobacter didelphidarum]